MKKIYLTIVLIYVLIFTIGYVSGVSFPCKAQRIDTLLIRDTITLRDTITITQTKIERMAVHDTIFSTIEGAERGNTIKCKVTYYQPTAAQCSGNPLKTADGSTINLNLLNANKLRWCAVSSDIWAMLPKKGVKRIYISGYIDGYNGWYEVHDKTAARHHRLVDILAPTNLKRGILHTKSHISVTIGK